MLSKTPSPFVAEEKLAKVRATIVFKKKIFQRSLSLPKGALENLFLDVYSTGLSKNVEFNQLGILYPMIQIVNHPGITEEVLEEIPALGWILHGVGCGR